MKEGGEISNPGTFHNRGIPIVSMSYCKALAHTKF